LQNRNLFSNHYLETLAKEKPEWKEEVTDAFNEEYIVLIDDARVYRVLERTGIKYISSVNIVMDACLTGSIDSDEAFLMLDRLRISISDKSIEKAKDVILKWK